MDKLAITDIPLVITIGVHEWEKQCQQTLHLDVVLQTDAKRIALTDSIDRALNYDSIIAHILEFAKTQWVQLIETFVEKLAQSLLQHFDTQWIHLTLHKPGAVLNAKNVSISIERSR